AGIQDRHGDASARDALSLNGGRADVGHGLAEIDLVVSNRPHLTHTWQRGQVWHTRRVYSYRDRVVRFSYSGDLASAERRHLRSDHVLLCEHLSRVVGLLRASRITFGVATTRLTERWIDETDPDVDLASGLRRRCRTPWNLQLGRVRKRRRLLRHAVAVRDAEQAQTD